MTSIAIALFAACAVHPRRIPDHRLLADDGAEIAFSQPVRIAITGNVERPLPLLSGLGPSRSSDRRAGAAVAAAIGRRADRREVQVVALLGDFTRWSRDLEWLSFDRAWSEVLEGETLPRKEGYRVPVLPVAGDHDSLLDRRLHGLDGAFPGVGADIGYNRVASWYALTLVVQGERWRFVVLDSDRRRLGARWNEQLAWIPQAVSGDYDNLVLLMHDSRFTLSRRRDLDPGGVPGDLVEAVEDNARLMSLRAVFSAGSLNSQVFLPDGRLGTAWVVAGGGGAGAEELPRWGDARSAGLQHNLRLEPRFDVALQREMRRRAEAAGWKEKVVDKARATGKWEGFTGIYDPRYLPLYGYWDLRLHAGGMELSWWLVDPGGDARELYRLDYQDGKGWS